MTNHIKNNLVCIASEIVDGLGSGVIYDWLGKNTEQRANLIQSIEAIEITIEKAGDEAGPLHRTVLYTALMESFFASNFDLIAKLYAHYAFQKLDLERELDEIRKTPILGKL